MTRADAKWKSWQVKDVASFENDKGKDANEKKFFLKKMQKKGDKWIFSFHKIWPNV